MPTMPRINDITTSFDQPPRYVAIARENPRRDYSYPAAFRDKQSGYYTSLRALRLALPPAQAFERIRRLAERRKGWRVVEADAARLAVEAVAVTPLLRFRDDVVIEARPAAGGGTEVHMRSKSRLGRHDFGANAKRIQAFLDDLAREPA